MNASINSKILMSDFPLVEILIPTFNRREKLIRAVESAKVQDYSNISIFVSNNGSDDGTSEYLSSTGIKHINHEINRGGMANLNFLWSASRAEYKLFLADDDWIDRDYVSTCFKYMTSHKCSQVGGQAMHYIKGDIVGQDACFEISDQYPLHRLRNFCNSIITSNCIFYGLRTSSSYSFNRDNGSDFADTYYSILNGSVSVISKTKIHRDFSNWYGDAAIRSSKLVYRELSFGDNTISLHSLLSFFTVASSIKTFLGCDWSIACSFAFLAGENKSCADTLFVMKYLLEHRDPYALIQSFAINASSVDLSFYCGFLGVLHALMSIQSRQLSDFTLQRFKAFTGMTAVQIIEFCSLWSDLIGTSSAEQLTYMRSFYAQVVTGI